MDDGIIRVFPRRTRATPVDRLCYCGPPDLFAREAEPSEVHVSVAFTWDIRRAEWLADQWRRVAPVRIGGPAYHAIQPPGSFEPGRYLAPGYTITSRGCPNRCEFCRVWRSGRGVSELPIRDGWIVQDDNLLACSESHVRAVFTMLRRQSRRAQFTGGLEAARLRDWHVDLLAGLRPRPVVWMAYDTPDDYEPLVAAGKVLLRAGFTRESHRLRCYCLIGQRGDTFAQADRRLVRAWKAGFLPFAMLFRDTDGSTKPEWRVFQRDWCRPALTCAKLQGR